MLTADLAAGIGPVRTQWLLRKKYLVCPGVFSKESEIELRQLPSGLRRGLTPPVLHFTAMKKPTLFLCGLPAMLLLVTAITPLSFTGALPALVVFGTALLLSLFLRGRVRKWSVSYLLRWVPVAALIVVPIRFLIDPVAGNPFSRWATVRISHRAVGGLQYIAHQFRDLGARGYARRTCQVTPVFPGLAYFVEVDTSGLSARWKPVDEEYNPFHWK
ncbi:hypothetical protein [Flaviaesturariibacter amylovorans]|uniref:Uncharacterized protein n=1 Tax=Flaviaesturariibacter amylovorans TaxID=1084520 RepID=A0ABP8H1L2_9BACT